ncbi:zinc transport system permease protein [Dysgonomonas sp. PH5-45]|uniref:metal ABC transporter permease n=1 Tax=unclassified Dysgonomonas TaxID=2630389 RepID=UPI002473BEE0|nr:MULTISPECIES: metal ABC transporter permease [unclassified Dysgonomonas]MDH6355706.1 zinc transport system permease protein [Dysgonomonas sp. PH5-45]MDH6388603.1 zinc transport system permease protein [Dysgonomonas sp. PH5-37]
MDILNLLEYTFFQNALIGSLFASIACGIIGTYIVIKRLVFISGGITHASLGGLGMGFYFGINPILSAMVFSILSAFGIEWLSNRQDVRQDSAIATFWSLGMAVGIIFIFLKSGFAPNLSEYLFGNILTITHADIVYLAILSVILTGVFVLFHKQILYVAFDAEFARTRQLPVKTIEYAMMFFIAVTIVLSIRLVGIVLLMSLLTVPQMTANLFTANFRKMIYLSILFGFVGCLAGLILSFYLNVPSGAFIIFVLILFFLACKGCISIMQTRKKYRA